MIISLGSELFDSFNETYTVEKILIDAIILKDSQNNIYSFPKEDMPDFRKVEEVMSVIVTILIPFFTKKK